MTESASADRPRSALRTTCGRELAVTQLALDNEPNAIERIALSMSRQSHDGDRMWASLTPAEARRLAHWLLYHASTGDQNTHWGA